MEVIYPTGVLGARERPTRLKKKRDDETFFDSPMLSAASVPVEVKVTKVEEASVFEEEAGRSTSKAMIAASEVAVSQMLVSVKAKHSQKASQNIRLTFQDL